MKTNINNFNSEQKIMNYINKLDYFFNSHKTLIITEIDLTNKCNNKCPGCCGINENKYELSKEQIDLIIEGLVKCDNKGVILSGGGEPLISPYFIYTLKQLRKNGIKIGVNSNGLALTEEKAIEIAENCEYFRVSLDAASPEMYKLTHGMKESDFLKTINNCKMFSKVKKQIGSSVSYGIGFLTSKTTIHEMEDFTKLVKDIGADFSQFRPFIGDSHDITNKYIELKDKYEDENFKVRASLQKYKLMKTDGERNYSKCRGMFFSTVITANAKVYSCIHNRQDDNHFLGVVSSNNNLDDIFRSSRIREVYNNIDCNDCQKLCRNDAFNRTLDVLSLDINHSEFL